MKNILAVLGKNLVEVLSGLLLALVGVTLTAASGGVDDVKLYLGGIATTLGGVLLSWTVGKAVSKGNALDEVRSQLGLVSKTLGQSAGQISRVVDQCIDHSLAPETGLMMIGQQAVLVGAQVSAIQEILGESFDTNNLLSTITEVDNLAEQLDRKDRRNGDVAEVRTRLKEIRAELTGKATGTNRMPESVVCPNCNTLQQAPIGVYPGDTAAVICRKCSRRFNTHRRSDGSVFSRTMNSAAKAGPPASSPERVYLTAECTDCKSEVRVPARPEGGLQVAVCTGCGESLTISPDDSGATSNGKYRKLSAEPIGRTGSGGSGARPVVHCDSCDRDYTAIVRKPGSYFALDKWCRHLFEVSDEAFASWRSANEPADAT